MLPIELWQEIISYLAYNDQLQLKSCCRFFNSTLNVIVDNLTQKRLIDKTNEYLAKKDIEPDILIEYLIKHNYLAPQSLRSCIKSVSVYQKAAQNNCICHSLKLLISTKVQCISCHKRYECYECSNKIIHKIGDDRVVFKVTCSECGNNVYRDVCHKCYRSDCRCGCPDNFGCVCNFWG